MSAHQGPWRAELGWFQWVFSVARVEAFFFTRATPCCHVLSVSADHIDPDPAWHACTLPTKFSIVPPPQGSHTVPETRSLTKVKHNSAQGDRCADNWPVLR
jgi:hypothetical protein